jgi:hypothetical protein
MKKIILAMILSTGLIYPAAFADDDSINAHLAHTLSLIFKITDSNYSVNANDYQQSNFTYNGMPVTAFKSKTSNWVGFFKKLSASDLPENALSVIKSKYKECIIENVTMYFNSETDISYFAEIVANNKCIVLKIQPSGHIKIFNCAEHNTK